MPFTGPTPRPDHDQIGDLSSRYEADLPPLFRCAMCRRRLPHDRVRLVVDPGALWYVCKTCPSGSIAVEPDDAGVWPAHDRLRRRWTALLMGDDN